MPCFRYAVSNPPYQEIINANTGASRLIARDIFPDFQTTASRISHSTTMVYPSTWQKNLHKGLGEDLLHYGLSTCDGYSGKDLFPSIVAGFPLNVLTTHHGYQGDILVDGEFCLPRDTGIWIRNAAVGVLYQATRNYGAFLCGAQMPTAINNVDTFPGTITNTPEGHAEPILIYVKKTSGTQSDAADRWVDKAELVDYLESPETLDSYQVAFQANILGRQKHFNDIYFGRSKLGKRIFLPGQTHGTTLATIRSFHTLDEALNFLKYMNTKFFYHLLSLDFSKASCASHVPDLGDYTSTSTLLDWDSPLDPQLYEMFHISGEDQKTVERYSLNFRF